MTVMKNSEEQNWKNKYEKTLTINLRQLYSQDLNLQGSMP
jgi:hypothetical protein